MNFTKKLNSVNTFVDTINRRRPELLVCDSATEFTIVLFDFNNADQSDTLPGAQFSDSNMYIFYLRNFYYEIILVCLR